MSKLDFIPVYQPELGGNEKKYVNECLDTTWISSRGSFIESFERQFCDFTGSKYATTVHNGTVALHLALAALDIGPGDEVIVPTFTYVASVNAIKYVHAEPVFVDSYDDTWHIDIEDVEEKITAKTKAVLAVHLYGYSCDIKKLADLCKKHNIRLIEDCAEAFGTYFDGKHVGTFSDYATFSFFGNKTITTGEGGMVVAQDPELYDRIRRLKTHAVSDTRQYWHDEIGYNFRMTNIQAAIGCAQLERAQEILQRKKDIAALYREYVKDVTWVKDDARIVNSHWMVSFLLPVGVNRDELIVHLKENGIDSRPFFYCAHHLPMYETEKSFPIGEQLSQRGINVPSWPGLADSDIERIANVINDFLVS